MGRMGCSKASMESMKAPLSMLLVQCIMTGTFILAKIILDRGTFIFAFVAYRSAVAALCIAPFAFFFEREMIKVPSWSAIMWIFINALFGITIGIGFYYYGLRDTTATYASSFYNLIPIVTFVFSVLFRMEMLGLGSRAGKAKIIGALVCVGGAMVLSLYKGKTLHLWPSIRSLHLNLEAEKGGHHLTRGTLFLLASCLSDAFWFIVMVKLFHVYSTKYWAQTLTCAMGCLQSVVVGLILDREKASWKLGWDMKLFTIVYAGALSTGVLFCINSWVSTQRGPTYPSIFNSLSLIFTAILESVLLGQHITIGSVLGMFLIIGGLYAFIWGMGREEPPQITNQSEDDEVRLSA